MNGMDTDTLTLSLAVRSIDPTATEQFLTIEISKREHVGVAIRITAWLFGSWSGVVVVVEGWLP